MNLRLDATPLEQPHHIGPALADPGKVESEHIKIKIAVTPGFLKRRHAPGDTGKRLIVTLNDFPAPTPKPVQFFQLGKTQSTLKIRDSIIETDPKFRPMSNQRGLMAMDQRLSSIRKSSAI
ncbi:MAG: hypothetical protein HQL89_06595 [Magnetococcales bacterium]|nr:hypothetical protein [Magnetococcales bacterium]